MEFEDLFPCPGTGYENLTAVVITTHGASNSQNHSRICISRTRGHALPTSELEAQTVAPGPTPARVKVVVSLSWRVGPMLGVLRGCRRMVLPLAGRHRCRRIGDVCPLPLAREDEDQRSRH